MDNNNENSALNKPAVRRSSSSKEPDYRTEKGEWLVWNMLEYGNSIDDACKLLRQKEIVDGF